MTKTACLSTGCCKGNTAEKMTVSVERIIMAMGYVTNTVNEGKVKLVYGIFSMIVRLQKALYILSPRNVIIRTKIANDRILMIILEKKIGRRELNNRDGSIKRRYEHTIKNG